MTAPHVPDISICIANWNGQALLRNLLNSLRAAESPLKIQIVVVDNASTDGSPDSIAAEFPEVVLVRNAQNLGFSRANNQAMAASHGRLLLFLNNDTIVPPGALSKLAEFLDIHPEYSAVGPRLVGGDGRPQKNAGNLPDLPALLHRIWFLRWTGLFKRSYARFRGNFIDRQRSGDVQQLAGAALMVRRAQLISIGGWDERYPFGVEDLDLCTRLNRLGKIYYMADVAIEHLGRVSSRSNRPFVYASYECGYARYVGKYHSAALALAYRLLITLDLPVRVTMMASQWLGCRLLGRREKSQRNYLQMRAAGSFFLRGLPRLWRS